MKIGRNKSHLVSAYLTKLGIVKITVQCHVTKMSKNVLAEWIQKLDVLSQIFAGIKMRIALPNIHMIMITIFNFYLYATRYIPYRFKKKKFY